MRAFTTTNIREIISQACKERGISLNRLALILGVTPAYLHDILSGRKVARPFVKRIANTLGIPDLPQRYEEFLHEKRMGSKGVENNGDESTEERGGGKDV